MTLLALASGPGGGAPLDLLAPAGLALAALLVPLVVLYILKVKRQRRRVASTWLWASAQRDLMARAPWKKFLAQVPLLLEALALLLLTLALARPATRSREILGDHVAILLDTSASMSALEAKPGGAPGDTVTRMALAKQAAKDVIASLTPGSDAMILEAGRDARLASPFDRDPQRLRAAIDRIDARDVEGDLGASVALAVDRLRQLGGSRRVVVITDGALAHPGALSGASIPVEVVTVGAPVDNAAIVRVDVRSGTDPTEKREQVQAFLVVANFGKAPRDLYVTMHEDNASDVLASRRVLVKPGERLPVVLTFHPAPADYRRGLVLDIAPHDAMPVDDVAYARVPAGEKLPVYLAAETVDAVHGPSPWVERALVSDPMAEVHSGSIAELVRPGTVPSDALVVLDGVCREDAPGSDLLILNPPPGKCFGTLVGTPIEHPVVTSWETGDPRLRFLTLDGIHITRANSLKPDGATQELIRATDGTIATDISTTTRSGTLVGFDVGDSDWPLKASFVLFMRNLLEQARSHRAHGMTGPARAGEPMRVTLPGSARSATVTGPSGAPVDVPVRNGLAVVPDIDHVGLYQVAWQGPQAGSLVVPANLVSEAESDLAPKSLNVAEGAGAPVEVRSAADRPDAHSEWTWVLALIALGLIVADVWWVTREPRVASPVANAARPRAPERRAA